MIFYVTFGRVHPLRHGYVIVDADDLSIARAAVFEVFGPKFCMVYDEQPNSHRYPAGAIGEPIFAEEVLQ